MFSYCNLVVSNAQAERSQLAGYRVSPGATMEVTTDAISCEIGHNGTSRFSRPTYRFALLLVASVAFAIVGIHGASAQGQPGLFADADGVEPPDMGVAYEMPAGSSVSSADRVPSGEHAGLVFDVDGIEPPDIGLAYTLPASVSYASSQTVTEAGVVDMVIDADGIEPPDTGIAYDTDTAYKAFSERQRTKRKAAQTGG